MSKLNHFLITRINIPYESTPEKPYDLKVVEASKKLCLDPDWLDRRVKLFSDWAFPSVLGQSTLNFRWLLLMNAETPNKHRQIFYNMLLPYSHFHLVLTLKNDLASARYGMLIHRDDDVEFLMETNLDSDDAISRNFLELVQGEFRGQKEIIDVPRGYTINKEGTKAYGRATAEVSSFRTLVEPMSDRPITPYTTIHGDSKKVAPLRSIVDKEGDRCMARWLQILHDENLTNKLHLRSKDKGFPPKRLFEKFNCPALLREKIYG
jgi:hypothetical protein